MTPSRFLELSAEYALRSGRPLDRELSAASTALGPCRHARQAATAAAVARDGSLTPALTAVPVDPLVTDAAVVDPVAAGRVGAAVRRIPRFRALVLPLALPAVITALVLVAEVNVGAVALGQVIPIFEAMHMDGLRVHTARAPVTLSLAFGAFALLFWTGICAVAGARIWLGGPRFGGVHSLRAARLLGAASVLARHGHEPAKTLPLLARAARLRPTDVEWIAPAAHDGAACERLAHWLETESERILSRTAVRLKVIGAVLALAVSCGVLAGVYRAIATVASSLPEGL